MCDILWRFISLSFDINWFMFLMMLKFGITWINIMLIFWRVVKLLSSFMHLAIFCFVWIVRLCCFVEVLRGYWTRYIFLILLNLWKFITSVKSISHRLILFNFILIMRSIKFRLFVMRVKHTSFCSFIHFIFLGFLFLFRNNLSLVYIFKLF